MPVPKIVWTDGFDRIEAALSSNTAAATLTHQVIALPGVPTPSPALRVELTGKPEVGLRNVPPQGPPCAGSDAARPSPAADRTRHRDRPRTRATRRGQTRAAAARLP